MRRLGTAIMSFNSLICRRLLNLTKLDISSIHYVTYFSLIWLNARKRRLIHIFLSYVCTGPATPRRSRLPGFILGEIVHGLRFLDS